LPTLRTSHKNFTTLFVSDSFELEVISHRILTQIDFVGQEDDLRFLIRVFPNLFYPEIDLLLVENICEVENDESSFVLFVKSTVKGPVFFLSGSIPDADLDLSPIDFDALTDVLRA
jgi:hypothetical protein